MSFRDVQGATMMFHGFFARLLARRILAFVVKSRPCRNYSRILDLRNE